MIASPTSLSSSFTATSIIGEAGGTKFNVPSHDLQTGYKIRVKSNDQTTQCVFDVDGNFIKDERSIFQKSAVYNPRILITSKSGTFFTILFISPEYLPYIRVAYPPKNTTS